MSKLYFTLIFSLLSHQGFTQLVEKLDNKTMEDIENIMEYYVWDLGVPGMAVGFIHDGKVAYTHGEGSATTFPDNSPFLVTTKSLLASVSKPITAIMALKLVQEGHLNLDTTIDNYISGYSNTSITIRHLLAHQSGIGHYNDCPGGYDGQWNASQSINIVLGCDMCIAPPGATTWYTTFGSTLLGAIIDAVGQLQYNQGFISLYNSFIKNPGNLTTLSAAFDDSDPLLAQGHDENGDPNGGGWEDIGWKLPAGGFISNIYDLAKFGVGVMDFTFIDSIHSNIMWQMQSTSGNATINCSGNPDNNYGLGWAVGGSGENLTISHNGVNSHGYRSRIELYPNRKKGIVLLMNQDIENLVNNIFDDLRPLLLCPNTRDFVSETNWSGSWHYKSSNVISASNIISNTAAFITYDTQNSVNLLPGFNAKAGVDFLAMLEGCGN